MSNGNPFYVEPLGGYGPEIGKGLAGLGTALKARVALKKGQELKEEGARLLREGTPDEIAEFSISNPDIGKSILEQMDITAKGTEQDVIKTLQKTMSDPEGTEKYLTDRVSTIVEAGGNPSDTILELKRFREDPESYRKSVETAYSMLDPEGYKSYRTASGKEAEEAATKSLLGTADIQSFEYLTANLPPEDKAKAKRIKLGLSPRATESAKLKAEKSFATEAAKLEAKLGLEPLVAGAVVAAKNQANAAASELVTQKSNISAWEVYNGAMSNLAAAMSGTATGPMVGFIPAITANSQIAEGAIAVMAPVLKQMFRTAGEGIFTDKDQELLMKMVPTRKDLPEARTAKITAIDRIVRAKLDIGEEGALGGGRVTEEEAQPSSVTSQAQYDALPSGALFVEDGVQYRKP